MRSTLQQLTPALETAAGDAVACDFEIAGHIRQRVLEGENVDVVMLQRNVIDELCRAELIRQPSVRDVARPRLAAFVRAGSHKPAVDTLAALKQTLLAARSLAYTDPASGGISGTLVARMLEALGLADAMKPKIMLGRPGLQPTQLVASGQAELGIVQLSEILGVAGLELAGALPEALQPSLSIAGGIASRCSDPAACERLLAYLQTPGAAAVISANGMLPA
jgi:molybdate transport system substrate-binding protein